MFGKVLIDVGKCTTVVVVVVRILCHMHVWILCIGMSGMSGSVAAVLPSLGAGTTGGVVFGMVSPAPKRIWLFGQSRASLRRR